MKAKIIKYFKLLPSNMCLTPSHVWSSELSAVIYVILLLYKHYVTRYSLTQHVY